MFPSTFKLPKVGQNTSAICPKKLEKIVGYPAETIVQL